MKDIPSVKRGKAQKLSLKGGDTMTHQSDWKALVGQQLQVANQQITLCQQQIQREGDCPEKQLFLQNALGAVAKAWETVEYSGQH